MVIGAWNRMRGQPLVSKLAKVAIFVVVPASQIAALVYSPPDYMLSKPTADSESESLPIG